MEEETMVLDSMTRERLLARLQNVFDNNAQNPGQSLSPHWTPQNLTRSGSDEMYISSTGPAIYNDSPWSHVDTHHPIPEFSRNDSSDSDPSVMDNTNIQYNGSSMESFFDISSFDNSYGTSGWSNRTGFDGSH
jgi:hypothetical protein